MSGAIKNGVSSELLALRDKSGVIDARGAVAWARKHPKSVLYSQLDWDDEHAAEEHRVWQVRRLVAIFIVDDSGARTTVSLSVDRGDGGYRAIDDVVRAPDLRAVMLADALAELKRVQRKYERLSELAKVWEEVKRVEVRGGVSKRRPAPASVKEMRAAA